MGNNPTSGGKKVETQQFGLESIVSLETRVAELERLLQFTNGDPNYLIEHRKRVRAAITESLK